MGTIESLQILRAIAAILVLLRHGTMTVQDQYGYSYLQHFFKFGECGVDMFFVLSGFIIYYSTVTASRTITIKQFLLRRFIKIFPIYWIVLTLSLALLLGWKYGFHSNGVVLPTLSNIMKSILLIPNDSPVLVVSWTLSFEIAFYLLFSILFFRSKKLFFLALTTWVMLCYANRFIFHIDYLDLKINPLNAFLNPIVAEFLFGCLVAVMILQFSNAYWKLSFTLGIGLFILAITVLNETSLPRELRFGIPSTLIIYGMANIKIHFSKLFVLLGDASYSLYLLHVTLLHLLIKIIQAAHMNHYFANFFGITLMLTVIIAMSTGIYWYIERPVFNFCKRRSVIKSNSTLANYKDQTLPDPSL